MSDVNMRKIVPNTAIVSMMGFAIYSMQRVNARSRISERCVNSVLRMNSMASNLNRQTQLEGLETTVAYHSIT